MERVAAKILKELLGGEGDLAQRTTPRPQQPDAADHWTRPILLERAAFLSKLAKYGEGSAGETIKDYPQHSVMLWFRSRNSETEVDEESARILLVLEGWGTVLIEGAAAERIGGVRYQIRAGDILHVPAGQPHQILVSSENPLACLVLKVRETPAV